MPKTEAPKKRRDQSGRKWTATQVERAVIAIVAKLSGERQKDITRSLRFEQDLGWDPIYKLSVVKPVRTRLHEQLEHDFLAGKVRTVGQLITYVWSLMEDVS